MKNGKAAGPSNILRLDMITDRSSRSQMFFKIGVLKYFAIFIGKTCIGVSFE